MASKHTFGDKENACIHTAKAMLGWQAHTAFKGNVRKQTTLETRIQVVAINKIIKQ